MKTTVTHRAGGARPGTLRLWTLQPIAVWETLLPERVLYVQIDHVDEPDWFLESLWMYDWMREQMAVRLPGYAGHYPWWAWLRPRPDLRKWAPGYGPPGARYVRLELALPPERVLLSVEPAWWGALGNRWYVGMDRADYADWDAAVALAGVDETQCPLPEPWNSRILASWERIFDVETLTAGDEWSDAVQAAFERLELADVTAATEFTARRAAGVQG